jgi:hypothetical protein
MLTAGTVPSQRRVQGDVEKLSHRKPRPGRRGPPVPAQTGRSRSHSILTGTIVQAQRPGQDVCTATERRCTERRAPYRRLHRQVAAGSNKMN